MAQSSEDGVHQTGAPAGSILVGIDGELTAGLRLQVTSAQAAGGRDDRGGTAITGRFRLLDAGSGTYSEILEPLVGQEWNADSLLARVQAHPEGKRCKYLLNRSRLKWER